ncbi:MAG: glutathione S-transferase N-terminal domain-containing protein [Sphingomonadales bacterium]|nr:glutathione S-transferase N-terminal domain-containing protein [Sphingomonadales bacterium]
MTETLILSGMNSPNVIKPILMLEECGLDYQLRHVAVFAGDQFDPAFVAKSPLAKVPVLEDPRLGVPLAESGAILLWLAEREGRFLPAQQPARALVQQWLMIQMANIGPMLGQYTHFTIVPEGTADYARARYRAIAEKLYRALETRLAQSPYLAGVDYSIADMATQPWAYYLERHGFPADEYPALVAWREAIAQRPATIRALARADEAFTDAANRTRKAASDADLDRFFSRTEQVPAASFSVVRDM